MESKWQNLAPTVTPNEADRVVELWLRQRLNGTEHLPVDTSSLTLSELARALGVRDEEAAALLGQIRNQQVKPHKRPMPVDRSWKLIGMIYACAALLAIAIYSLNRRPVMSGEYPVYAYGNGMPVVYGNEMIPGL